MIKKLKVITIDGPAGSGKSTVAKLIAAEIGWIYVTTGAIYRTFALLLHEENINIPYEKNHNIERFVSFINERYRQESKSGKVFIGDREITYEIQSPKISSYASILAQDGYVRDKLLPIQRKIVLDNNGAVVDGRDMGTVVFPDALLKIFLTASPEARASRRLKEFVAQGEKMNLEKCIKEIKERDHRDINRENAPLKPASDALILDSTNLSQQEIMSQILHLAVSRKLIHTEG